MPMTYDYNQKTPTIPAAANGKNNQGFCGPINIGQSIFDKYKMGKSVCQEVWKIYFNKVLIIAIYYYG